MIRENPASRGTETSAGVLANSIPKLMKYTAYHLQGRYIHLQGRYVYTCQRVAMSAEPQSCEEREGQGAAALPAAPAQHRRGTLALRGSEAEARPPRRENTSDPVPSTHAHASAEVRPSPWLAAPHSRGLLLRGSGPYSSASGFFSGLVDSSSVT